MARPKFKSSKTVRAVAADPVEIKTADIRKAVKKNGLILFDLKTKLFLFLLIGLYFFLSLLKIHTSSIGNWEIALGQEEAESVIAGKPRNIRVDEWMVSTPAIIGQYYAGMPLSNPADGDGNAPVVYGLPVKDMTSILRPAQWSYFLLDAERAFAFSWNFNIFFFLISMFLVFMLLTKNNFWVSVTGALFIFLSSAVQWWSYIIGSEMMYLNGVLISFIYLLYGKKISSLVISGVIFLLSVSGIFFNLYPPFQIPLIYLYLLVFVGFFVQRKNFIAIREKLFVKSIVFAGVLLLFGMFVYHYYTIAKETYSLVLNTAYPGKRFSTGGGLIRGKLFSDFFGIYMSDTNLPSQWVNICEESNFIMFFPVIFYVIILRYIKFKTVDPLLLSLSIFVLIGLFFVLAGFPVFLSKASLLSMSPSYRALPVLGAGNAVLLFYYLGNKETGAGEKFTWMEFGILAVAVFMFISTICSNITSATANFFSSQQVIIVTLLMAAAYLLIRYKSFRFITPITCLFLLALNISNAAVHPLSSGLSSLLENPLVEKSKEIYEKDPQARWVVFGSQPTQGSNWANIIKTSGINVLNGVKWVPALKDMAAIDSTVDPSIYNRYAHIDMQTLINGDDAVRFKLTANDAFSIAIDPCSPRLRKLGVKYFAFTYKPQPAETRCLTPIDTSAVFFIYKRNDQ
jgi:hypothetical protein